MKNKMVEFNLLLKIMTDAQQQLILRALETAAVKSRSPQQAINLNASDQAIS